MKAGFRNCRSDGRVKNYEQYYSVGGFVVKIEPHQDRKPYICGKENRIHSFIAHSPYWDVTQNSADQTKRTDDRKQPVRELPRNAFIVNELIDKGLHKYTREVYLTL